MQYFEHWLSSVVAVGFLETHGNKQIALTKHAIVYVPDGFWWTMCAFLVLTVPLAADIIARDK